MKLNSIFILIIMDIDVYTVHLYTQYIGTSLTKPNRKHVVSEIFLDTRSLCQ